MHGFRANNFERIISGKTFNHVCIAASACFLEYVINVLEIAGQWIYMIFKISSFIEGLVMQIMKHCLNRYSLVPTMCWVPQGDVGHEGEHSGQSTPCGCALTYALGIMSRHRNHGHGYVPTFQNLFLLSFIC